MPRSVKITIVAVLLIVGGYLVSRINMSSAEVPTDFYDARSQGALIAENIVTLSNELSTDLGTLNQLEQEHKTEEALALASELLKKSQDVRARAVELSQQLARMTSALEGIKSQEARGAALEAIADRLALINRLINYSDYLAQLLNTLRDRIAGAGADVKVKTLVDQINAEVTAINNFNRQAVQAMERFDQAIK